MKNIKKILAVVIAVAMVLAMGVVAFAAQGDDITATEGSITIENAANGETYRIFKIFDATISKKEGTDGKSDSIAYKYTGDLPTELAEVFEKDGDYVKVKEGKTDEAILAAVKAYVATLPDTAAVDSKVGTGDPVVFDNLDFGYYAVKSTQGAVVTIDSTNPDVVVYDKNTTVPTADKKVEKESYSIGDTVKYTATFNTTNWLGEGADAQQVTSYVISDTLPEFLSNVTITSVKVITTPASGDPDDEGYVPEEAVDLSESYTAFDTTTKSITIPWATEVAGSDPKAYKSIYPNGADIEIKYQGILTSVTNINTADTNTVTIQPNVWNPDDNKEEPWDDSWSKDEEIRTYAAALKKTDGTNPLPGAQFTIKGLTVTGSAGEYTVVSYNPAENAPESAVLDTDANGKLYIVGLASDVSLTVTEYKAPDGYNKLNTPTTVKPQLLTEALYTESGTIYYDAKGNVVSEESSETTTETVTKNLTDLDEEAVEVVNNKGSELPTTGGIGTTIFYIVGAILVIGGGILLISKRRMRAE